MLFVLQRGQTQLIELCTLPLCYGESDQSQSEHRQLSVSQGANMNCEIEDKKTAKKNGKMQVKEVFIDFIDQFLY